MFHLTEVLCDATIIPIDAQEGEGKQGWMRADARDLVDALVSAKP